MGKVRPVAVMFSPRRHDDEDHQVFAHPFNPEFLAGRPQSGRGDRSILTESPQAKALPGLTPAFLRTSASGQKPVKDACSKLAPTKAVSQSQFAW